ncbi:hypothetical protein [Pedobacter sp. V48]|uniref:hypothetical protein n=1 Tax=Pedobacter sp. V48 TaxID=509635 RepID=UPI0003E4C64C|nr:hypothetical protein [Pedobacter sp. V48]ETZ23847.1 hypothetical protein N824_15025 [Pedobacter sp. V48]
MNNYFTAIVLSYKRPQNIQRICETILSVSQVCKLILSNNNPEVDLKSYVKIDDNRFVLINQERDSGCIKRYELAYVEHSEYYFCIDDDLFLSKTQIQYLMVNLINDPFRPHGFWGQSLLKLNDKISFGESVVNCDQEVDILNRAYFFTRKHVVELFRLLSLSQIDIEDAGLCDDIFLSSSGVKKPSMHFIGKFEDCPTSNEFGIASWKGFEFEKKRQKVLERILNIKEKTHTDF